MENLFHYVLSFECFFSLFVNFLHYLLLPSKKQHNILHCFLIKRFEKISDDFLYKWCKVGRQHTQKQVLQLFLLPILHFSHSCLFISILLQAFSLRILVLSCYGTKMFATCNKHIVPFAPFFISPFISPLSVNLVYWTNFF